jgi:transposase
VVDARGREVVRHSVGHSAAGLRELISVLRGSGCGEVAIERPDGPVVDALLEAGLTVVVSPNQVKNLRARTDRGAVHQTRTTSSIPVSIPPEALMRVRLIRPGNMAQAIASRLSTLRKFASEVVAALRDAAAVQRGHRRTGESP